MVDTGTVCISYNRRLYLSGYIGENREKTHVAPTNGTNAYDLYEDEAFDLSQKDIPEEYIEAGDNVSKATKAEKDGHLP